MPPPFLPWGSVTAEDWPAYGEDQVITRMRAVSGLAAAVLTAVVAGTAPAPVWAAGPGAQHMDERGMPGAKAGFPVAGMPTAANPVPGTQPRTDIIGRPASFSVRLRLGADQSRCLDADADHLGQVGDKVQNWACLPQHYPTVNQVWEFSEVYPYGLYHVKLDGGCLDADLDTINRAGTKVQLWNCLGVGQLNQYWWLTPTGNLVNDYSGTCLDADLDHLHENGSTVQLWPCLGADRPNQQWIPSPL